MENNEPKKTHHLRTFVIAVLAAWVIAAPLYLYFYPHTIYNSLERGIVDHGLGGGGIPINTLYTVTAQNFVSPYASGSRLLTTGANHDTLYTAGWLNLSKGGPQILRVPDMAGRYYSVEFCDPSDGTIFSDIGTRTTGTQAGDYLISGPAWKGAVPSGMTQISSPNNSVLVLGRILVYSDSDLPTAYGLAKQIQLTPLHQK